MSMANFRLDYIWLDGYQPTANIRTKAQIIEVDTDAISLDDVPVWGFDGSSTQQAESHDSDCILQPGRVYNLPSQIKNFQLEC
jgi:glutamine synthetase